MKTTETQNVRVAPRRASSFTDRNDGRKEPSAMTRYSARSAVVKTKSQLMLASSYFNASASSAACDIVALVFFLASVRALNRTRSFKNGLALIESLLYTLFRPSQVEDADALNRTSPHTSALRTLKQPPAAAAHRECFASSRLHASRTSSSAAVVFLNQLFDSFLNFFVFPTISFIFRESSGRKKSTYPEERLARE